MTARIVVTPHSKVFYGAQATDDCFTEWNAIKVYQDGVPIHLGGPFKTREEAEDLADTHRTLDALNEDYTWRTR
jgi:hypothetical protein